MSKENGKITLTLHAHTTRGMVVTYEGSIDFPDGTIISGTTNADDGPELDENTTGKNEEDAERLLDAALSCIGLNDGESVEYDNEDSLRREAGL